MRPLHLRACAHVRIFLNRFAHLLEDCNLSKFVNRSVPNSLLVLNTVCDSIAVVCIDVEDPDLSFAGELFQRIESTYRNRIEKTAPHTFFFFEINNVLGAHPTHNTNCGEQIM